MAKSKLRFGRGSGKRHPVDVHVGARVKQRRNLLGMTQTDLGKAIGVTFQQAQKYERGVNRIGASRLLALTQVLDVPVNYFFEDMPPEVAAISPVPQRRGKAKEPVDFDTGFLTKRETLKLVRTYYKIENEDVRKGVYQLTKAMGAAGV